jgi:hypothetical protein
LETLVSTNCFSSEMFILVVAIVRFSRARVLVGRLFPDGLVLKWSCRSSFIGCSSAQTFKKNLNIFKFRGLPVRGPYEPSFNEFAECVCTALDTDEEYTYNKARTKCRISHSTIRTYVTIGLSEVNREIKQRCGRLIKPKDIVRPGFTVLSGIKEQTESELCPTELDEKPKTPLIPRDLLSKSFYPKDMPSRHSFLGRHTKSVFNTSSSFVV